MDTLCFNKQRIVVVGAGDHSKVVLETLLAMKCFDVAGLIDPDPAKKDVLGFPVLGGDELLPTLFMQGVTSAVIAIGENRKRQEIGTNLLLMGFTLPSIVHPLALISPTATIARGVVVMAMASVGTLATVDDLAIINTGAIVEHDDHIGRAAHIAPGSILAGRVHIGDRVLVGVGSAVRPYISIGMDAIIGAGSVVVKDVSPEIVVAGVPAQFLRNAGKLKNKV